MQKQVELYITEFAKECRIKSLIYSSLRQSRFLLVASLLEIGLNILIVVIWYRMGSSDSGFLRDVPIDVEIISIFIVVVFFVSRCLAISFVIFNYFSEIRILVNSDRIYLCKVFGGFYVSEIDILNLGEIRIDLSRIVFLAAGIFHNFLTKRMMSACNISLINQSRSWSMNTNLVNCSELRSILVELGCKNITLVEQ